MSDAEDKRQCIYCNNTVYWNWNGQKLKDGSKIYVDDRGMRWAGRRCPACEKSRVSAAIKHDHYERSLIVKQFVEKGFKVVSTTLPLKVEKDGQVLTVGIRRASTEEGRISFEPASGEGEDIVAVLFESVRLCTPEQLAKLAQSSTPKTP